MSSKFPMVAIDKVEVKLTMKAKTVVTIDNLSKVTGLSRAAIINGYVEDGISKADVVWTSEDEARVEQIKAENRAKRERLAMQKGGK